VANILDAPMFRNSDRKAILSRVQAALQASPDCRFDFKGTWKELTRDENANWDARQCILMLRSSFPIDKTLEALSTEEQPESPVGDLGHAPDQVGETQTTEV
jgi:hypothetical protein